MCHIRSLEVRVVVGDAAYREGGAPRAPRAGVSAQLAGAREEELSAVDEDALADDDGGGAIDGTTDGDCARRAARKPPRVAQLAAHRARVGLHDSHRGGVQQCAHSEPIGVKRVALEGNYVRVTPRPAGAWPVGCARRWQGWRQGCHIRAKQGYRIYERIDMLNNGIDQSRAQPHRSVSTQCRTRLTRRCRRRSWRQWWRRLGTAACEVHPVGHRAAVAREMRTTRMRTARRVGQQRSHRQEEKHAAAPVTDVRSKRKKAKTR